MMMRVGPMLFGKERNSREIQGAAQISTAFTRYFQAENVEDSPSDDWHTTASWLAPLSCSLVETTILEPFKAIPTLESLATNEASLRER